MILNYANIFQGGDIEDLQVPVGGDQLTGIRLQGATALRNGSLTSTDRLEHLNPVIVEMFHTLQDFIEVIYAVNFCNTFIIIFSMCIGYGMEMKSGSLYFIIILFDQ